MNSFLKLLVIFYFTTVTLVASDEFMELTCTSNGDCASFEDKIVGSDCREGKCTCWVRRPLQGEELMPCIPRSNNKILGERSLACPCEFTDMECVDGFCKCKNGLISHNNKCTQRAIMLGKSCEVTEQCKEANLLTECKENLCVCKDGFMALNGTMECRSIAGSAKGKSTLCNDTSECHEHEECKEGHCLCLKGFVASTKEGKCVQNAHFGEACHEDTQCEMGLGAGSVCEKGVCACGISHTYIQNGDKSFCLHQIFRGDPCKNHYECVVYKQEVTMKCLERKCECAEGYELHDAYSRKCVKTTIWRSSSDNAKSLNIFITLALIYLIATFLQ